MKQTRIPAAMLAVIALAIVAFVKPATTDAAAPAPQTNKTIAKNAAWLDAAEVSINAEYAKAKARQDKAKANEAKAKKVYTAAKKAYDAHTVDYRVQGSRELADRLYQEYCDAEKVWRPTDHEVYNAGLHISWVEQRYQRAHELLPKARKLNYELIEPVRKGMAIEQQGKTAPTMPKLDSFSKRLDWYDAEASKIDKLWAPYLKLREVINDKAYRLVEVMADLQWYIRFETKDEQWGVRFDRAERGSAHVAELSARHYHSEHTALLEKEFEKGLTAAEYVAYKCGKNRKATLAMEPVAKKLLVSIKEKDQKTFDAAYPDLLKLSEDEVLSSRQLRDHIIQPALKAKLWVPVKELRGVSIRYSDKGVEVRAHANVWKGAGVTLVPFEDGYDPRYGYWMNGAQSVILECYGHGRVVQDDKTLKIYRGSKLLNEHAKK
jgi:hypothetical protein